MALQGNLCDFSITQLLNLIHITHKTGTLTLQGENEIACLVFREGRMIYGERRHEEGRLVSILRYNQLITEDQAAALRARPEAGNDKKIGLLLVQANYLSQQVILQAIQKYLIELVYHLFTWREGAFQFFEGILPPDDRITVLIDLEKLIREGTRRMSEWETLEEEIPDLNLALKFIERQGDPRQRNIDLNEEEWRVVSCILPQNTMHYIARTNHMHEMELRRIVHGLLQTGVVAIVQPEGEPPPAPPKIQPLPKPPEQAMPIQQTAERIHSRKLLSRENVLALFLCLILVAFIILSSDQSPRWIYQGF
jgi:hypothetical protein